jgi:hypothetical protein
MAMTAVALMAAVMMAAAVTANATVAVAAMVTAMTPASQRRQRRQQQFWWGEIQQSTKKGATERAIAKETATVTVSDDNEVNADAKDIALTTAMRTTHPGCASRWCSSSSLSSSMPPPSSLRLLLSTTGSSPLLMATPGSVMEIMEEEYLWRRAAAPPTSAAAAAMAAVAEAAAAAAMAAAAIPNGERCDHCPHFPVCKHLRRNPLRRKKRQKKSIFIYGNNFKEKQIFIWFSANPDLEQSLTKTKKELQQAPTKQAFLGDQFFCTKTQSRTPRPIYCWKAETVSFLQI